MRRITALLLCIGGLLSQPAFAQNLFPVRFAWGTEFFPDNFQAIRQHPAIAPGELVNGYYFRFIQCSQIPSSRERAEAEALGLQFITYVQFGTYLVAIPQFFDLGKLDALRVRSVMTIKPEWKMSHNLKEEPYGAWAVHRNLVDVDIQVYPQLRIAEGAARCREAGFEVLSEGNQNGFISLRLRKESIGQLAALPFVRYLELLPPPGKPEDTGSRALHRSNLLDNDYATGLHYNGEGVNTLVRDDGPIGPHVDFKGRLDNLGISASPGDINHADWVGSCVGGAGNIDPTAKGMAAGALIYAINYLPSFQDSTLPLHLSKNITLTNTSYSNGCNDGYTLASQTVDQQLFDNPTLLHVFSAGNSNGSNCDYGAGTQWGNITGGHKMSKNSIAVANLAADGTLNSSSSRGPAYDGRLKPEISAHGTDVNMTQPNNTYSVTSGTSFASPNITGCMAQLTQVYKELHGGELPKSSLLKAAAMNTANDLGNVGPDFQYGFGHINVYRAMRLFQNNGWTEGSVDQAGETTHNLQIPANTRQVRVMIYWIDPPAQENASKALINDLDLTLVAPDGSVKLPWRLDPTPDPVILNTPAGKGRDSLNNFEQVVVDSPPAGTYKITIKGFEVPMGPQNYVVVWELLNDNVKFTYPNGGEGFVAGEKVRLQWDAYGNVTSFTLRYSADNGATFNPITTVTGEKRAFDWTIPNTIPINGQMRLLMIRGNRRDTTDAAFTVSPIPDSLRVEKVCPDSMTVAWKGVNDTLTYDVFLLGSKYMEIAGTSDTNFLTIPLSNPAASNWISIRTSHPNGLTGRRALAIEWPGGLKNCAQANDVAMRSILSPEGAAVISCGAIQKPVTVRIVNEGLNPISGALVNYQLNNTPAVSEALPDIPVGDTLDYTFTNILTVTQDGTNNLKIWSTYGPENVLFNDTLNTSFYAIANSMNAFFQEDFQGAVYPPTSWSVINPDEAVTWAKTPADIPGADGQPTRATYLPCFNYPARGEEDYLYLVPIDLNGLSSPGLTFDLSHADYNTSFSDSLFVEVFEQCDLASAPKVVYAKGGADLSTASDATVEYVPSSKDDWRNEAVSLQQFAGQRIIVRFVSKNDYGNDIYVDNINLKFYSTEPPVASIVASTDSICRLDTVVYTAGQPSAASTYTWQFGSGGQPASTTGPGPHNVRYLTSGAKTVRLIATNPNGADTTTQVINVLATPVSNFTSTVDGPTATFTNSSTNAQSYLWSFGDNTTSTETNPVHVYAAPGNYTVTLLAMNSCDSILKSQKITLTFVGTQEQLPEFRSVKVLPNPTEGDFRVELGVASATLARLSLFDTQGRLIKTEQAAVFPGVTSIPFQGLNLAKGLYQLRLQTDSGQMTFSVVVQ